MAQTFTDTNKYKVVRIFRDSHKKVTIHRNLTINEARSHCDDPETSWATCTSKVGKARTRNHGPWFDSFQLDN